MSYLGDLAEDALLYFCFTTRTTTGVPTALLGTPALAVYIDDSITQSTVGITLTVSLDGVVGLNNVKIDTSADAFYAVGGDYSVVVTAGTVGGVSVVGEVVGTFSIENRFDVVGSVTGAVGSVTGAVGSVTGAVGSVGGNVDGSVGSLGAQAKLDVNAEVDAALDTAIPLTPTTDSVNQRLVAIDDLTQASGGGDLAAIAADVVNLDGDAMRGTDAAALASVCTEARLAELDAANLPAVTDDILIDTAEIGTAGAGLTGLGGMSATMKAQVNTEVDSALDTAIPALPTADSINERVKAVDVLTEAAGGGDLAAILADTNELQGDWVNAGRLDTILDTVAADVVGLNGAAMRGTDGAYTGTPPTVVEIADQVWDEAAADHVAAGSFGTQCGTDIDAIAIDVAGLDGDAMRGTDSAALASVCTEVRLAELDAANLPSTTDSILVDTAVIGAAGAGLTDLGGMSTTMKAQVNTEAVDALATDTYAQLGQGAPPATLSIADMLRYIFKAWRNKTTQTATQYSLYNDDAATVDQKATFGDDGVTATRGEIATGP